MGKVRQGFYDERFEGVVWTEYPFGKGDLTSDGIQYSAEVTTTDRNWTEVEQVTIEPPSDGVIIEVELAVTHSIKSTGATKYVKHKVQARNKGGTWVDLYSEVTRVANASAYAEVTYSDRFPTQANFNAVPFDVRIVIQREDATENAVGKARNAGYVRVRYATT